MDRRKSMFRKLLARVFTRPAPAVPLDFGNWLRCDGRALDQREYADLFANIGTAYGGTATTFNLPDLRHRGVLAMLNIKTGQVVAFRDAWSSEVRQTKDHVRGLARTSAPMFHKVGG